MNRASENESDEKLKKELGYLITHLVRNQVEVALEAGIVHVISLVRGGFNAECKISGILVEKVGSSSVRRTIARDIAGWGGIAPLAAMVHESTAEGKTEAARTLMILANNADYEMTILLQRLIKKDWRIHVMNMKLMVWGDCFQL